MALLGLELAAGLSTSVAVAILAVLWNYSDLPGIDWTEITAGVTAFVAGAGLELLAAENALGAFAAVSGVEQVAALLNLLGGLLVLVGGLVNGARLLQGKYA